MFIIKGDNKKKVYNSKSRHWQQDRCVQEDVYYLHVARKWKEQLQSSEKEQRSE